MSENMTEHPNRDDGLREERGIIREGSVEDISDAQLVERAVRNARRCSGGPMWGAVMEAFGLGSTYAAQLCSRFGVDPYEQPDQRRHHTSGRADELDQVDPTPGERND